jgi:3-methyladenine DNA glycosylase AlkD
MEPRARLRRLIAEIEALADPAYRQNLERLVPGARMRGVRVPALRALAVALVKGPDAPGPDQLVALMDLACASGHREELLVATFALARSKKALAALDWEQLTGWLPAIDNWETCDQLATAVAAPLVAARPALAARLEALARSRRFWNRRFALATAVGLNQRGRQHPAVALRVLEQVAGDREPMVAKAIGWLLREVAQVDPAATAAFVSSQGARLPRAYQRQVRRPITP